MKTQFQAKDIQQILEIPKHRYEYIASKIGIKPEIEEVEKTGHVHLYSFKNLLEFAIVNTANNIGIGPKAVKDILIFLSNTFDLQEAELFNPEKTIAASLHYIDNKDGKVFKLSGSSISEQGRKATYLGKGFDVVKETQKRMSKNEGDVTIPGLVKAYENLMGVSLMSLENSDGYITINIGVIKDRILKKIK